MSWGDCMLKKIVAEWGPGAEQCAKDIEKGNLPGVAECIATVVGGISSGAVLVDLSKWSIECEL